MSSFRAPSARSRRAIVALVVVASAVVAAPSSAAPATAPRRAYPTVPDDPLFVSRDQLTVSGQWGLQVIRAPHAWQEKRATGAGISVAVLDSGLDLDHPDFSCRGKVRVLRVSAEHGERPEDATGHGTHVAGIIGACTHNRTGVAGAAPDVTLLPYRVLGARAVPVPDAIRAATDAGAHVINMSFAWGQHTAIGVVQWRTGMHRAVEEALAYARERGVVLVAAAGNDRSPLCAYPAWGNGVVCVGSTDRRDLSAHYSSFAVKADDGQVGAGAAVVAPGGAGTVVCSHNNEGVLSTYARRADACDDGAPGYRLNAGTSMASPHVAGVAALVYDRLRGVRSTRNADLVVGALRSTAVDLGPPGWDPVYGSGRVDALAAVRSVRA